MRRSRYVLVGLVPLLILAGLVAWDWVADLLRQQAQFRERQRLLGETIAEIDAADPGWRWADRIARPSDLPDDKDFLDQIRKINRSLIGRLFDDTEVRPNQLREVPEVTARRQRQPVIAETRSLAGALTNAPSGFFPPPVGGSGLRPDFSYLDEFGTAIFLLSHQVEWLALEERPAEAMPLIRSMLVISETPDDSAFLIGYVLHSWERNVVARSVERVLGLTEPGEELGPLLEPLRRAARGDLLDRAVRSERARRDGICCFLAESPETLRDDLQARVKESAGQRYVARAIRDFALLLPEDHASQVRKWTAILKTFDLPLHERPTAIGKIQAEWPQRDPFLDRILPLNSGITNYTIEAAVTGEQFSVARLDCARVALACELFRHRWKRWPETLSEIPKDLLPEIPADPFDGKPLRYRVLEDGIAVWSIGEPAVEEPPELSGGKASPTNTVFRVWNPDRRRLPAPPELLPKPVELPDAEAKERRILFTG